MFQKIAKHRASLTMHRPPLLVSPSNPKRGAALFAELTQDELICSNGGDRGQMSASTPAVLFSTGPV